MPNRGPIQLSLSNQCRRRSAQLKTQLNFTIRRNCGAIAKYSGFIQMARWPVAPAHFGKLAHWSVAPVAPTPEGGAGAPCPTQLTGAVQNRTGWVQ